ncbi:unnamed protein product, partial [Rotaria sp. Silwood2]
MGNLSIEIVVLLLAISTITSHTDTTNKRPISAKNVGCRRCQKPNIDQPLCFCGKNNVMFNCLKGDRCINGEVVPRGSQPSNISKLIGLRLSTKRIHQSTRDDKNNTQCIGLRFKRRPDEINGVYVPLRSVSVEAWIDSFAADVTLTQVFVNQEKNAIEAVYVFPIEVNVGALAPGKECRVIIKYVTELDLIDGNSIRFVVPTTIAPRYNPSLGHLQSPDGTQAKYVQKAPYSMKFKAHVLRGEEYPIRQVANLSHP